MPRGRSQDRRPSHGDLLRVREPVTHVVGTRPNFMKAAPVIRAMNALGIPQRLVHTGQHYDLPMSGVIFEQLGLKQPDVNLNVRSGSHAQQTAAAMSGIEADLLDHSPSMLIVYGDVNSSLAGALVGAKLNVPVAHVEAGVRSFDRSMPEEINRLVIDRISTHLFTPSPNAGENLQREGVAAEKVHCAGNVMIDSLRRCLPLADASGVLGPLGLGGERFVLVTLHRPATVDDQAILKKLFEMLSSLAQDCPVVFPVHPRTRQRIHADWRVHQRVHLIDPVGYLEMIGLQRAAGLVITDSGGMQVETSFLGVPCLTFRDTTEWPETISAGTNTLAGRDPQTLLDLARRRLGESRKTFTAPFYWDGHASERIAMTIATF